MCRVHLFAVTWGFAWCIFLMKSTPSVTRARVRSPFANMSISSILVKRPYFLRLPSALPQLSSTSRAISGRKRSENRKALFSFVPRRTKRRHDSPSLRNLTKFRSTSTSTSFSHEAAAMQNEKRQTRQRTFSSLLLNLLIEDVIVTVLQLRLPSFETLQSRKWNLRSSKVKCVIDSFNGCIL